MPVESNVDIIAAKLDELHRCLDLTRPGIDGSLGRDLLANQAVRILDRSRNQEGSLGVWADNRGEYKKEKDRRGLPVGVGLPPDSIDRMLSLDNLKGERAITPSEAVMTYGITDAARDKAESFSPGRPFYEYTEADIEAVADDAVEAARHFIETEW